MKQKSFKTLIFSIAVLSLLIASSGLASESVSKEVKFGTDNFLLQQNFNSSWSTQTPPPGWTIFFTTPTGASDWHREGPGNSPWSDNNTDYACLYEKPHETGEDIFTSPVVNCSLHTDVALRCSTYFVPIEGFYMAKLQGSTNNGSSWFDIFDYFNQSINAGLQVFDCPWANNCPNVKFRWYFSGNTGNIYHWSFDNVAVTGTPIVYDAGVSAILAPVGTVDSGAVVTPMARVKNLSNVNVTFPVIFRIGSSYTNMKYANDVAPGDSAVVSFDPWIANQPGAHLTRCTTALEFDANPSNDTAIGSVLVRLRDVGVTAILAPPAGTIDSSGSIIPQAKVKNNGSVTETFTVAMRIGAGYIQTRLKTLNPGQEDTVFFTAWNTIRGTHTVRCSTFLFNDINPLNDTMGRIVTVRVRDAGVIEIIEPTGVVNKGETFVPKAKVQNFGTNTETFPITFQIGAWTEVLSRTLLSREISIIEFPSWTAQNPGTHMVLSYTSLAGDLNPDNDVMLDSVIVEFKDIGIVSIASPSNYVLPETITPLVWIKNYGTIESGLFDIRLDIEPSYSDTQSIANINPGDSLLVSFTPWGAELGEYMVRCTTMYDDDNDNNNDVVSNMVVVTYDIPLPGSWSELSQVIPGQKPLKRGSCMEVIDDTLLYVIKGYKTFDFYRFNTVNDSWHKMPDVPSGLSYKQVKKGSEIVGDGQRYLYFVKGSNLLEFFRYDTETDTWKTLKDVPYGGGKKVKDGAAMAYVEKFGNPYIYFIKGSKTLEFYRYDITNDSWQRMPDGPAGKVKPGFKKGTDLCYYPEYELIYCLKDKSNEMFVYDVMADSWLSKQQTSMPFIHPLYQKRKKVKNGGALCYWDSGKIFALKGGNTPEFWLFTPVSRDSGTWSPQTLIPMYGTSGRKKRVKDGGALVKVSYHGYPALLATKGNKTERLWRYASDSAAIFIKNSPTPENNVCEVTRKTIVNFTVAPNPVRNLATVNYSLPNMNKATVRLYNVVGKIVNEFELTKQKGKLIIETEKLPAGVYLLNLESNKYNLTKKIILSH
jgi:hypothetical protein